MGAIYHMALPAPMLQRGFWLYVWKVCLPNDGVRYYVGMTGDVTGVAQSPFNRVTGHLSSNKNSNALRKYLRMAGADLESCKSFDLFVFGPIYPVPDPGKEYKAARARVATLESRLWYQMKSSGFDMLNPQPGFSADLDFAAWREVCAAFKSICPR
jgi:hypothetical protein